VAQVHSGRDRLGGLIDALLQVRELDDPDVWDAAVEETERRLGRDLEARRFPDHRRDVQSVLRACLACTGGLRSLARVLHAAHPESFNVDAVAIADGASGPGVLSEQDREDLLDLFDGISDNDLSSAVTGLSVDVVDNGWAERQATLLTVESQDVRDGNDPVLMTFVDQLIHLVEPSKAHELRRWIDTVSGGLAFGHTPPTLLAEFGQSNIPAVHIERPMIGGRPLRSRRRDGTQPIWGGGVPIRNLNFTGRGALLDRLSEALRRDAKASLLPQTLQGMGGVGKTQLAVEYVYRNIERYDLIWWIPAEQTAVVLESLAQLAERLGLAATDDRRRTARTVLDALSDSGLAWLLVYDNVDDGSVLDQFVPSHGGHVILTTRNQQLASGWPSIAVDVFERSESIELLQRRSQDERGVARISTQEAFALADKLGDLPLALEQAVSWYLATAMPVGQYIELLDSQMSGELLSEGKPKGYPVTVAAFVKLAVEQLRVSAPATAQMFELFGYLGGEPIAVSMLRYGRDADITEPLKSTLSAPLPRGRVVRDLSRFGLAKIDQYERLQVHRLVQRVLRESLGEDLSRQALRNAQNILAAANPGDPDEVGELHRQRDLGAHLDAAQMIYAENFAARRVVLDHARYLYVTGNYEDSRDLAQRAVDAWSQDADDSRSGPTGELTLMATTQLANATRTLGDSAKAGQLIQATYDRLSAKEGFGERHESTLVAGNQIGHDLRIAGRYQEALDFDVRSVALHSEVFGPFEKYTLRAKANLAVDYRMVGQFEQALALDRDIASHWESMGGTDPRALAAYFNMVRDYYGIGAYQTGLDVIEQWRDLLQDSLGSGHSQVLLAGRTHGVMLRKAGRRDEAVEVIRDHFDRVKARFDSNPNHEFVIAAGMSLGNALREVGRLDEALVLIEDSLKRYQQDFGDDHPLTLAAHINEGILRRARGEQDRARDIDERCFAALGRVLSMDHPYTICAGTSLATDHSLAGEHEAAVALSQRMLELSRPYGGQHEARGGTEHPYLLMRAVNLAHDLRAVGDRERAEDVLAEALRGLRESLGPDHPDVRAIERRQRTEGDIEPPPT